MVRNNPSSSDRRAFGNGARETTKVLERPITHSQKYSKLRQLPIGPSDGAAPELADLASGNVLVVYSSVPEARAMRDAGRVKPLAVRSEERLDAFPDVPTVRDAIGEPFTGGSWPGIVAPAGLPDGIRDRLVEAMTDVYNSEDYQEFMSTAGLGLLWHLATNSANCLSATLRRVDRGAPAA